MARFRLFSLCASLFLAIGCANRESANKEVVRRMVEAINARNLAALDQVVAANIHRHSGATPGVVVENLEQFKAFLSKDTAAVAGSRQEIQFMLAEGDRVAVYLTLSGTQRGQLGPYPPSNRHMEIPFIGILRLEDGKIAEMWVEWDNLNMLTQLGHFTPTPPDSSGAPES